jgi:hypothetical protein
MMVWQQRPTQCPEVQTIDVSKLVKTSKLINGFNKGLPPWAIDQINVVIDNQGSGPPPTQGYSDPTGGGAIQTRNNSIAVPSPSVIQPPFSPPPGNRRKP